MRPPENAPEADITCEQLALFVQEPLRRRLGLVVGLFLGLVSFLLVIGFPNADALGLIVAGSALPLILWIRQRQPSIPLLCLVALQTLAIFATPILSQNPTIALYPREDVFAAAREVLFFSLALCLGWALGHARAGPAARPRFCWVFKFIRAEKPETLQRGALLLLGSSALYQIGMSEGLLGFIHTLLPAGSYSVIRTLFEAATVAGGLIGGYAIGTGSMSGRGKAAYWILITLHFFINSSSILLSSNAGMVAATTLGLFLGARRPPWLFLALVLSTLSLLNLGKFQMRAEYWDEYGQGPSIRIADYPTYYARWVGKSVDLIGVEREDEDRPAAGQRLTDRLDNLQNLLFAQVAIEHRNIELLGGETYAVIPQLLIPRVFWPGKPRSHEGQIILNVHFGRQRLEDTFTTYIAWGLLAEAYANFGSLFGALFCGAVLGVGVGFAERWIKPYPITSLQAFFFLIVSVNLCLSFEMVASVWITSLFQMVMALVIGVFPLAQKRRLPEAPAPA